MQVAEQATFDEFAEQMDDGDMPLLDALDGLRRHDEKLRAEVTQPAAIASGEADRHGATRIRLLDRANDVLRVAAGTDRDKDVPGPHQRLNLTGEDVVEFVIVGPAGERRRVQKVMRRQTGAIEFVARNQLLDQVHGVARRPAIATGVQALILAVRFRDDAGHPHDLGRQIAHGALHASSFVQSIGDDVDRIDHRGQNFGKTAGVSVGGKVHHHKPTEKWSGWVAVLLLLIVAASCGRDERVLSIGAIHSLPDSTAATLAIDASGRFWLGSPEAVRLFGPESTRMVVQHAWESSPQVMGRRGEQIYLRVGDTVFVHGAADNLIARGSFGANPVVVDARGRALLQGASSGAVLAHHPDSLAPIWGWAARATPSTALAVSPEGDRVYHAVIGEPGGDAQLLVRDLQTGRVLHVMTAAAPLRQLQVDARGWLYALEGEPGRRAAVALQPGGGEVRVVWRRAIPGDSDGATLGLAVGDARVAVWGGEGEEGVLLLSAEDGSVLGRAMPAPLDGAFDPDGSFWVLRPGVLHRLE